MTRGRKALLAAVLALSLAAAGAAAPAAPEPRWTEVSWPFPRDAFPKGRAFRCAGCGQDLVAYVRPKLGFCNCTTGVTDDAEVDGVSDLDMIAADYRPMGPGMPRLIGDLPGRSRSYSLTLADGKSLYGAGIAVSRGCDLVAVAVVSAEPVGESPIAAAASFLGAGRPMAWLEETLAHP